MQSSSITRKILRLSRKVETPFKLSYIMQFDELLGRLNGFGRYQWAAISIAAFSWVLVVFNHMSTVFIAATSPFVCGDGARVGNLTNLWRYRNGSAEINNECLLPRDYNLSELNVEPTDKCESWTFDVSFIGTTIVSQVTF